MPIDKPILDMTLRELQEADMTLTIKVLVHKIAPADSLPTTTQQQPSRQEMRNILNAYVKKFGPQTARDLIGIGTTLDQIMNDNPDALYRKILNDLDAPVQEDLKYD